MLHLIKYLKSEKDPGFSCIRMHDNELALVKILAAKKNKTMFRYLGVMYETYAQEDTELTFSRWLIEKFLGDYLKIERGE